MQLWATLGCYYWTTLAIVPLLQVFSNRNIKTRLDTRSGISHMWLGRGSRLVGRGKRAGVGVLYT